MSGHNQKYVMNVLLVVILLLFMTLVFAQSARRAFARIAGDFHHPFLSAPVKAQQRLASQSLLLENKQTLAAALEKAERLNLQLAAELAAFSSLQQENAELRHLLNLKTRLNFNFIPAEIILRDPSAWEQRLTINKGSDHGVRPGSIVVAGGHPEKQSALIVIGRVTSLSRHNAEVNTLVSQDSRLSVTIPACKADGILSGGFRRGGALFARMLYLPRDLEYLHGSKVYTSGLTRGIPQGLYIGGVNAENDGVRVKNNLHTELDVELAMDLNATRFVLVIPGDK